VTSFLVEVADKSDAPDLEEGVGERSRWESLFWPLGRLKAVVVSAMLMVELMERQ